MKAFFGWLLLLSGPCATTESQVMSSNYTVNVALGGKAVQSPTSSGTWYAGLAIDGKRNANIHADSCSTTDYAHNPWWRVDLLDVYNIHRIVITNRGDCCPERIKGAEIRIGNSLDNDGNSNTICAVISSISAGASSSFTCNMNGRYVSVVIPGQNKVLTLCEVEVYRVTASITKKEILRMKFHTSKNMADPTEREKALQKLKSVVVSEGESTVQLYWSQQPKLELKTLTENKGNPVKRCGH